MSSYPHLFQEGRLGRRVAKNRVVMSPMSEQMANPDGSISEQSMAYYTERAKGGTGTIILGSWSVDYPRGKMLACQHRIDHPKYIKDLARLAQSIHRYGALILPQLQHAGMRTNLMMTDGITPAVVSVGAADFYLAKGNRAAAVAQAADTQIDLTTQEIEELVQKFITAAVYCQKAGCDGVEIHAAHAYLISQFLTPVSNQRKDKYGGSLENRMRFALEVIRGIRQSCGPDFILGIRMAVHKWDTDGTTDEESVIMAKAFEAAGCDFIDASMAFPPFPSAGRETQGYPQGNRVELAAKIKRAVSIPVVTVGVLREPGFCDRVIRDGLADFVALGRTLICDPYWAEKARTGRAEEIRKCISCLDGCFGSLVISQSVKCALNPVCGNERDYANLPRTDAPKNVVVVGGGLAGMQAAITAASIGHRVTLLEKANRLGGQLNLACVPPKKDVVRWATDWFVGEVKRQGVDVMLDRAADVPLVKSLQPDVVIVATGAIPWSPPIPGAENGVDSWKILDGTAEIPEHQKVVIAGGGIVGCETALLLKERGNDVTIIEMLPAVAPTLEATNRIDLLRDLEDLNVNVRVNTVVKRIEPHQVLVEKNGKEELVDTDVVVLALGRKPFGLDLVEQLKAEGMKVITAGDINKPAKMIDATRQGFEAALNISEMLRRTSRLPG